MENAMRLVAGVACLTAGMGFVAAYALSLVQFWPWCYAFAVVFSFVFLWLARRNLISLSSVFVALSLIAVTLPAVPYFFFGFEPVANFIDSIYLNTAGFIFFLAIALLFAPMRSLRVPGGLALNGEPWQRFCDVNMVVCLLSLPFVLAAITAAGAWGYLFGARDGGYDRIASMKGLGPLMMFSVVNVMALFFWTLGEWTRGRKVWAIVLAATLLFLNGFTQGRQNFIFFFFAALLIYVIGQGLTKRAMLCAIFFGIVIVLLKVFRVSTDEAAADYPWQVVFFLHFAGDFDSLNNVATLVEYTREHGFFGLYHIWSNLLVYVPRELFPGKPHDLGALYLNTYLFPGVYLGAEGGTGLAIGYQGLWYAVFGLPTLVLGNLLLGVVLCMADRKFSRTIRGRAPSTLFVAYVFLIGQSVIIYRDGFYAFMNTGVYVAFYYLLYTLSRKLKNHAIALPPRILEKT